MIYLLWKKIERCHPSVLFDVQSGKSNVLAICKKEHHDNGFDERGGCQINPGHAVFSSTCSTLVMLWSVARQGRLSLSRATACKAQIDKISQRLLQT